MRELILVRHGLAGSNRDAIASCSIPGAGLTPEGVEQARQLATILEREPIEVAVTSRLARTQETLSLAVDGRALTVEVAAELDETHFGSFDGGLLDAYRAWAAASPPDEPPPGGGESRAQAADRFAQALRLVLARPEQLVLVVGHALAIRYTLDGADGLVPAARMAPVAHAFPYRLDHVQVERAARLLEAWSRGSKPAFRDPSNEG
jgi:broad specificity phosphatase PhoE